MIIAIRRYLKGPGFKIILWLTLISVAGFWGLPSLFKRTTHPGASGGVIATVNGMEISQQEYQRNTNIQQEFLRRLRTQYGQYADLFIQAMGLNSDPKTMALETLVRETLLNESAESLHINLTPGYIESELERPEVVQRQLTQILPAYVFDETGGINPAALSRYLTHERISHEELNELIKEALTREVALGLVNVAPYVPQFATQEQFMKDIAKKQYSIMTIAYAPILKKEQATELKDEEIKRFFEAQNRASKRYWTPEKRIGTTWTFDAKTYGVKVDDKDIESYYQDYKGQKFVSVPLKIEARTILLKGTDQATFDKAAKLQQELVAKPDFFAAKAKEISEDKETAKNGGLVPLFAKGTHDKTFEKTAFLLKNDGDISEPVTTARGIEIVQRVSKKPAEYKPLSAVKDEIKEILTIAKFKEEFSDAMHSLVDQNDETAFNKFVQTHGAIQNTISALDSDTNKAAKILFGLREKGALSSYYDNSMAVAVRLDEIKKREVPSLESVKAVVVEDLHKERADKAFNKMIKGMAAQAVGTSLATLAKSVAGSVESTDWVTPGDTQVFEGLKKKNIPVDLLSKLDHVGSIASRIDSKNGYIVRLDALESFDAKAFKDKQQELRKKLEREYSSYFVEGFVASLYRNATIKTSESMANTAREDDYIPVEDYL